MTSQSSTPSTPLATTTAFHLALGARTRRTSSLTHPASRSQGSINNTMIAHLMIGAVSENSGTFAISAIVAPCGRGRMVRGPRRRLCL